MTIIFGCENN